MVMYGSFYTQFENEHKFCDFLQLNSAEYKHLVIIVLQFAAISIWLNQILTGGSGLQLDTECEKSMKKLQWFISCSGGVEEEKCPSLWFEIDNRCWQNQSQ